MKRTGIFAALRRGRDSLRPARRLPRSFEPLETRRVLSLDCTYGVSTTVDELDNDYGPGDLSLREAMLLADASPGPDVICVPAGHYRLTLHGASEDAGLTGDLDWDDDQGLTIVGVDAALTVIDGDESDRVFHDRGAGLVLQDLTLRGGRADVGGGLVASATRLVRVAVVNNSAAEGGGIYLPADADLELEASHVGFNTAALRGGGILAANGNALRIVASTVDSNFAGDSGGGLHVFRSQVAISESTVSNNVAGDRGGAIVNQELSQLTVAATSITQNFAGRQGGGLWNESSTADLIDSSLTQNSVGFLPIEPAIVPETEFASGGGVYNLSGFSHAVVSIRGGTVSDNVARTAAYLTAEARGGAISNHTDGGGDARISLEDVALWRNLAEARATDTGAPFDVHADAFGGAIFSRADEGSGDAVVTVVGGRIADSRAAAYANVDGGHADSYAVADGGAIYNVRTDADSAAFMHLRLTTLDGNLAYAESRFHGEDGWATAQGGGIANLASLTVERSTLSRNSARSESLDNAWSYGGAIWIPDTAVASADPQPDTSVFTSTLSGNDATAGSADDANSAGGAIFNSGGQLVAGPRLTIAHSTITGNAARAVGPDAHYAEAGGVKTWLSFGAAEGGAHVQHSILAANTLVTSEFFPPSPDVSGSFDSQGYNLIGAVDGAAGFGAVGDQTGTAAAPLDPRLLPLADYGGPTETHLPLPGSPVIDAGNPDLVFIVDPLDQRGLPRQADGDGDGTVVIDVGSVEVQGPLKLNVTTTDDELDDVDDPAFDFQDLSLREAVAIANARPGLDQICVPAGRYVLTRHGAGEDGNQSGDLDFTDPAGVMLSGDSAGETHVDGDRADRVFHVLAGGLALQGLAVRGGETPDSGGGLAVAPGARQVSLRQTAWFDNAVVGGGGAVFVDRGVTLIVEESEFYGNRSDNLGAAISTNGGIDTGTLNWIAVRDSSIHDNYAGEEGGALYVSNSILEVSGSEIERNRSDGGGGGVFVDAESQARIADSRFVDNVGGLGGGLGIMPNVRAEIVESSFRGNASPQGGAVAIGPAASVQIRRSQLTGNSAEDGGAINNAGELLVEQSTLRTNQASDKGGALYSVGQLTIATSTLAYNSAAANGGALYAEAGESTLRDSTLSDNSAANGGAVYIEAAQAAVQQSTLSGNSAAFNGGGVYLESGSLDVAHSTLADNRARQVIRAPAGGAGIVAAGGGIFNEGGSAGLDHTIVDDNWANLGGPAVGDDDLAGQFSGDWNLVGTTTGFTGIVHGVDDNQVGVDARLAPLGDYGGPTQTHLLLPGSPAIDAGDSAFDPNQFSPPLDADQRGLPRVVGSPILDSLPRIDLGAVELQNAQVVGRHVFYNNSAFDGNDPAAGAADDDAVASDKQALLPGQSAGLANYTSYSKGINGIMIDVAELPGVPTAADLALRVGNNNAPGSWAAAPAPSIAVRTLAGGVSRITLVWPDGAIKKQWLQASLLPTIATGLGGADVFYFGNAIGETGNSTQNALVNAADELRIRVHSRNPLDPAPITDLFDVNRDRLVNATDQILARTNSTTPLTALVLLQPPSSGAAALAVWAEEAAPPWRRRAARQR